jgi:acyl-CoA synthetase (AMP-forming)/AMP-acid ligase II
MNTVEFLQISSAVVPDREALVEVGGSNKRVLYMEMYSRVVKLANALAALGLQKGDHVAVMSVNSADYVTTYYACAMQGLTFVPLNNRAKDEELTYMLNVSQTRAIFVSDRYIDLVERIRPGLPEVAHYIAYDGSHPLPGIREDPFRSLGRRALGRDR